MKVLYGGKRATTEVYRYQVNQGGELNLRVSNGSARHVNIEFVGGEFVSATHDIEGAFVGSKSYWKVMGAIARKIEEIEGKEAP